ncbi:MAG: hypothetical protein P4M11_00330 [Candidatus Pacebacteria bacterium]|nr:hypothetical protein [Candidatus Paceibacterota bacterium]
MLALTTLSAALTGVMLVGIGLPDAVADGSREITAMQRASLLMDTAYTIAFNNFASVASIASSTTSGITTSLTILLLPDGSDYLTSTAEWHDAHNSERYSILHGIITNYKSATKNSCNDVLLGNWNKPQVQTYALSSGGLIQSGVPGAHPISVLAVNGTTLAVGISTTSSKTDPSLFLFDLSLGRPSYLGSIDNASSTTQGINGIALSSGYAYVANAARADFSTCKAGPSCSQMQIFNVGNARSITDVADVELATATPPFAVGSDGQSIGKSIAYANGYAYLGTAKTGAANGDEFNVFNVQNPQSPVWLGGFSVGRSINRIVIHGTYAYLATDDSSRELIVLDVHDPTHISQVGTYDAPGAANFGYGNDLAYQNTTLALGRTYSPNGPGLSILSIASTAPSLISTENIASPSNPASVEAMLMRSFLLFVLTNTSLEFFDIKNPYNPVPYADTLTLPFGSVGTDITCQANTIFVSSVGADQTGYLTQITGS